MKLTGFAIRNVKRKMAKSAKEDLVLESASARTAITKMTAKKEAEPSLVEASMETRAG